jgi:hypothetical protein
MLGEFQGAVMRVFLQISFLIMGIVQFFAAWDGFMYLLGVGSIVGGILAFLLAYVPLVGSIVGMYGAVKVWDWSFLQAFVLFFWYQNFWAIILSMQRLQAVRGR